MNALWEQWRKNLAHASVPASARPGRLGQHLSAQVGQALAPVTRACAGMTLAGAATSATQSYLTGHPYLPAGQSWPSGAGGPQIFVGQFNFAELGGLPGFPNAGLLQWFVDADDCFGLTLDDSAGATGFTVRWYPDPSEPSRSEPDTMTPTGHLDHLPMEFVGPTALTFQPSRSIPAWTELSIDIQRDPIWERVAVALGEGRSDPAFVYDEYIRGDTSPLAGYQALSKIGGYPTFTQADPRGSGSYPEIGSPAAGLLVELDSMDVGGWGDSGIAHLFGDPTALAAGDTSGIRYHWDCM